jgi:hypothetical protein
VVRDDITGGRTWQKLQLPAIQPVQDPSLDKAVSMGRLNQSVSAGSSRFCADAGVDVRPHACQQDGSDADMCYPQ